jgi:hypothetical protein
MKKVARTLRLHRAGILAWPRLRISNGALEGMNNKVKVISHRAYGFSTSPTSTTVVPASLSPDTLWRGAPFFRDMSRENAQTTGR